jgi:hypothetical protein
MIAMKLLQNSINISMLQSEKSIIHIQELRKKKLFNLATKLVFVPIIEKVEEIILLMAELEIKAIVVLFC